MAIYATRADVFAELDPRGFVARPRPIANVAADVNITTGVIFLEASAFDVTAPYPDRFRFTVTSGGTLPAEFATLTYYTPIPLGFDLFKVANLTTGLPIAPLVSAGSGWAIAVDPLPRIDRLLARVSGELDQDLAAQKPPLLVDPITAKYPEVVIGIVARETARRCVNSLMFDNAAFRVATDRLFATAERDEQQRNSWRNGQPILPRATDQDGIANDAMRATSRAAIGWVRGPCCTGGGSL